MTINVRVNDVDDDVDATTLATAWSASFAHRERRDDMMLYLVVSRIQRSRHTVPPFPSSVITYGIAILQCYLSRDWQARLAESTNPIQEDGEIVPGVERMNDHIL